MNDIKLKIENIRPYFAEIPYYLWGMVNYNSEGDCSKPTDQQWTWLELTHRETGEWIEINYNNTEWIVSSDKLYLAARTALFLKFRCEAIVCNFNIEQYISNWDNIAALRRADKVVIEFSNPKLSIFDSHLFWGSWKWIGWFATEFTWTGRWIMCSVIKNDSRGVALCIDWLKQGTHNEEQSRALRLALSEITSESFQTDKEWIRWYNGGLMRKGGNEKYPEPDYKIWQSELEKEYGK